MSRRPGLMDATYGAIRRRMLDGTAEGRMSRRKLAAELGVSPGAVQTALERLEGEGLLVTRPQSGTRPRIPDSTELDRVFDLREVLEGYAAGRAATHATPDHLARIDRALRDHARRTDLTAARTGPPTSAEVTAAVAAQHAFHGTILEAADNPIALRYVENLHILGRYAQAALSWPRPELVGRLRDALADHAAIAVAIRAGRAGESESLMREHVRRNRAVWPAPE